MTLTAAPATRPAPLEPTTPIRPSEAIRLGCLIYPRQVFGHGFEGPDGACAIGAMNAGGFPGSPGADLPCPVHRCLGNFQLATAAHLNDDHRWSRERIADWLEGLGL